MKKTYIMPGMQVHHIATNQPLLAGSNGDATSNISSDLNDEETTTPGARRSSGSMWD